MFLDLHKMFDHLVFSLECTMYTAAMMTKMYKERSSDSHLWHGFNDIFIAFVKSVLITFRFGRFPV